MIPIVEATIAELRTALESGATTSVELTQAYLARIRVYDQSGIRLNSIVELNPDALADAQASDRRRTEGATLGPLDGIPFTAKDSYMVRGMTVAVRQPRLRGPRRPSRRILNRAPARRRAAC